MRSIIFLFTSMFLLSTLNAQTKVVKGQLTVFNQYPVANLEVTAKKSKSIATTDAQGNFELDCNEKDVITIKGKVFQSVNKRVGRDEDFVKENLIYIDNPKNRELATSLGYITQENLDYAVKNLQYENNDYCNYSDVWALIRAKFSTVEVGQTQSGEMGVNVGRGQKSLTGESNAIYYVDGMKSNDISYFNPCEIGKIEIVQSGTAAKYGAGAANGVVVIYTKGPR